MIEITIEQFEQFLPFVGAASEDVFYKTEPSFGQVYNDLVTDIISPEYEKQAIIEGSSILNNVTYYIVLTTFLERFRSHDVIMTSNGFGVVSNDNIAPASQARVDALEKGMVYNRDCAKHNIINELRRIDGWSETEQAYDCIHSFLWSPVVLRRYYYTDHKLTFDDLAALRPLITAAEDFLRKQLSDEFIEQLLNEERTARFSTNHRLAKLKILDFIAAEIVKSDDSIGRREPYAPFESVLRFIEEHIEEFAVYRDSITYKANHMQNYENKTNDTTFFFAD